MPREAILKAGSWYQQVGETKQGEPIVERRHRGEKVTLSSDEYDRLSALGAIEAQGERSSVEALSGKDLDAALEANGLSTDGKATEKRARLQAYLDANPDATPTPAE